MVGHTNSSPSETSAGHTTHAYPLLQPFDLCIEAAQADGFNLHGLGADRDSQPNANHTALTSSVFARARLHTALGGPRNYVLVHTCHEYRTRVRGSVVSSVRVWHEQCCWFWGRTG